MITYQDILKQYVSTGIRLKEYQLDKISKSSKDILSSYFRMIPRAIDAETRKRIFDYEVKYFDMLNKRLRESIVSELNSDSITVIASKTNDPEIILHIISDFDTRSLYRIIAVSPKPSIIINYIINNSSEIKSRAIIASLRNSISNVLTVTPDPDFFINYFNFNLSDIDIYNLIDFLQYSPESYRYADILMNRFEELDIDDIVNIFIESKVPDKLIPYFQDKIDDIDKDDLIKILENNEISYKMIPYFENRFDEFNSIDVYDILRRSLNPNHFVPYFINKIKEFDLDESFLVLKNKEIDIDIILPYIKDLLVKGFKENKYRLTHFFEDEPGSKNARVLVKYFKELGLI